MQILKNRPLALFCCVLSATAVLALSLPVAQKRQWLIIALLLCSLFYLLARLVCRFRKLFLYGVYLFLGFGIALTSSYLFFDVYLPHTQQGEGEMHHIEGVVFERTSSTSFSSGFYVQLLSLDGEENHETVYLSCDYSSPLQLGDYFAADVYQERMESDQVFRDAASLLSDGITRILTLEKPENCLILKEKCRELPVLVKQWNHQLSSRLYHAVEGQEGALAAALLLGNRSFLSGDTTLAFRRAGISHLLALSGMHVAVIAGFLEILLRRLRFSKLIRAIAVPPVLIGYLLLTGVSPSTVRAVVMISVLYLGFLLRADYDSVTAVCVVPAAFMIISPNAVYDLSLWMSFLAAFSIIVFYPVIRAMSLRIKGEEHPAPMIRRSLAWLFEAVAVGVVANAALILLTSAVFGETSLMSVPATVVLSLPMTALLLLSVPTLIAPGVGFFAFCTQKISAAMLFLANWFSNIRDVLLCTNSAVEHWFLIFFTAVMIALALLKIRHVIWYSAIPIGMAVLLAVSICITVGQEKREIFADESFGFDVIAESGNLTVYDRSEGFSSDVLLLRDAASKARATEIEHFYICQYDNRRPYLLAHLSSVLQIRNLYLPTPRNEREQAIAKRLEQEAALHQIRVCYEDVLFDENR